MKEKELIKQYMENNQLNIEKIMENYTPYLYTILKNKKPNIENEDIEEIISDVFLAVWKNQKKLELEKDMSSYLVGVLKNLYYKKIRNLKNTVEIEKHENTLYEIEGLETQIENTEKNNIIMMEINNMKQEDKEIFMSYYYYAKSIKEIANTLKIAETKVKSRLFRIRQKLKKVLEKRGYHYYE